jgi:hypothetical protein
VQYDLLQLRAPKSPKDRLPTPNLTKLRAAFVRFIFIVMLYRIFSKRGVQWHIGVLIAMMALFSASMRAQVPPPSGSQPAPPPAPPLEAQPSPPVAAQPTAQPFTEEELKQLVGPIALYPDALIALILPASTVPSDLVLAARFVASKGDPAQAANQPWDDSVKSLARYPDIVKWMDQNLEWTTQLGEAFLDQPADVMNTIQQLRAQARAAGTLVDTPQQKVVEEKSDIRIVPAEPEVIYVPQYDPEVVFVESGGPYPYGSYDYGEYGYYPYGSYGAPYWGSAITFGIGFAVGPWLNYDCDWPRRKVCVGNWNPRWRDDWDPKWRRGPKWDGGDFEVRNTVNVVNINNNTARDWEPSPKIQRQHWQRERNYNANVSRENFRGRKNQGGEAWRRFSSVQRPSRLKLDDQEGHRDRQDWRRSNRDGSAVVRNESGEFGRRGSRVRDVTPGPEFDPRAEQNSAREGRGQAKWVRERGQDLVPDSSQPGRSRSRVREATPGPQFDQGAEQNATRESRGRAKRDREIGQGLPDSRESGRSRSRVQDATPGPQFDQGAEQNATREWRGREKREQGAGKARSQSFSQQRSGRPSDVQERRFSPDGDSVRPSRSSPSPNRNSFRSQQSKRSVSNAGSDSGAQVRPNRGSSEVRKSPSHRTKEVRSQRSDGPRQAKSGLSRSRASQGSGSNYSRPNSSRQSARVEKSGDQSRRSAPSYSRQGRQQSASAAGKSRGGGRQNGGKNANKDSDRNKD